MSNDRIFIASSTTLFPDGVYQMSRKFMQFGLCFLMLMVAVPLVIDLIYLVRGSLELYPSPEKDSKIRMVTGIIAALLIGIEVILWRLLRHVQRP
jgi:hypothetical protein